MVWFMIDLGLLSPDSQPSAPSALLHWPAQRGKKDTAGKVSWHRVRPDLAGQGQRAVAAGPQVAWARLCHHPSLKTSVEGALTYVQWSLPAATTGGEQVLLLPGRGPQRESQSMCAHSLL